MFAAFSSLLDIHTERLVLTIELTCVHSAPCVQGPEFTELADDLQEAFQTYVEKECGIDGDVAAFIAVPADGCDGISNDLYDHEGLIKYQK